MNPYTNLENPVPAVPVIGAQYKATSNRDYKGRDLPSIFGAEQKGFSELAAAKKWLDSIRHGGRIDQWDERAKKYIPIETVAPAKAVAK